jgi:hypothetical protein
MLNVFPDTLVKSIVERASVLGRICAARVSLGNFSCEVHELYSAQYKRMAQPPKNSGD